MITGLLHLFMSRDSLESYVLIFLIEVRKNKITLASCGKTMINENLETYGRNFFFLPWIILITKNDCLFNNICFPLCTFAAKPKIVSGLLYETA